MKNTTWRSCKRSSEKAGENVRWLTLWIGIHVGIPASESTQLRLSVERVEVDNLVNRTCSVISHGEVWKTIKHLSFCSKVISRLYQISRLITDLPFPVSRRHHRDLDRGVNLFAGWYGWLRRNRAICCLLHFDCRSWPTLHTSWRIRTIRQRLWPRKTPVRVVWGKLRPHMRFVYLDAQRIIITAELREHTLPPVKEITDMRKRFLITSNFLE